MLECAAKRPSDEVLKDVLTKYHRVAVVGLSSKKERDSNRVAGYLLDHGYEVIPVNPVEEEVLGQKSYPDLASVPGPLEIVDVFRRSDQVEPVAAEAVRLGAKVLWLQEGVKNAAAAAQAEKAGLVVVEDTCMKVKHQKLLGGQL
ncbi:MAG: CoA-binding protein [Deltaproteobacteria bacterium]|nr:CoA-binding protein [Deltaproteobacteria bacterium]